MTSEQTANIPLGVMDQTYAADRKRKPHLAFRYRCRAMIAARMYRQYAAHDRPPRILDLGSADGLAMAEVHRLLGAEASTGIEFDQGLIEAAELPAGCRLYQGDVTRPHGMAPAGSFDLVTALAVLEHVDDVAELGKRVAEALAPGGLFVATCPSGVWDRISGSVGLHKEEHHTGQFDRRRFEKFATDAGLTPVKYQRFMFAPVGFLPYLKVPVPVGLSLKVDGVLAPIPLVNLGMVNQVFVARRGENR